MFALIDDKTPPRQNVGGFLINDLIEAMATPISLGGA